MRKIINLEHPVRKIPTSSRSITGLMPTSTSENQYFESTLERDLMYLLKFDLTVDRFVSQPVNIKYIDEQNTARSYTPDLIIYHQKPLVSCEPKRKHGQKQRITSQSRSRHRLLLFP